MSTSQLRPYGAWPLQATVKGQREGALYGRYFTGKF